MPFLGDQAEGDIPIIYNWLFADVTARAVALDPNTGLAYQTADLGKVCKQADTLAYYTLEAITPTWRPLGVTALSGDVAVSATGVATVTDLTITSESRGDILRRGASSWERYSAKTDKQILIGDGTDIKSVAVSGDISITNTGVVTVKRPYCFTIQGALTTSSYAWIPIPYAMELSTIHFEVTTAVATSDMNIEVTYGTNPASMATLYASSKPKIASAAVNSTGTEGTLTTTSLAQFGYVKVTLSGTFTAATDLTCLMLPA